MTTRERWIVYPLLLMTLGIVMRDKVWPQRRFLAQSIEAQDVEVGGTLRCDTLVIDDEETEAVRIGVVPGRGGQVEVCGRDGQRTVILRADVGGEQGIVEALDRNETVMTQLRAGAAKLITFVDETADE